MQFCGFVAHNSRRAEQGVNWPQTHIQKALFNLYTQPAVCPLMPRKVTFVMVCWGSIVRPIWMEKAQECARVLIGLPVNALYWRFCQICLLRLCKWLPKLLEQSNHNRQGRATDRRSDRRGLPAKLLVCQSR